MGIECFKPRFAKHRHARPDALVEQDVARTGKSIDQRALPLGQDLPGTFLQALIHQAHIRFDLRNALVQLSLPICARHISYRCQAHQGANVGQLVVDLCQLCRRHHAQIVDRRHPAFGRPHATDAEHGAKHDHREHGQHQGDQPLTNGDATKPAAPFGRPPGHHMPAADGQPLGAILPERLIQGSDFCNPLLIGSTTQRHVAHDIRALPNRRDIGLNPVEITVLAAIFDVTRPGAALLEIDPQILKSLWRHIRMTNHIVRLADQLGLGITADVAEILAHIGDPPLEIGH